MFIHGRSTSPAIPERTASSDSSDEDGTSEKGQPLANISGLSDGSSLRLGGMKESSSSSLSMSERSASVDYSEEEGSATSEKEVAWCDLSRQVLEKVCVKLDQKLTKSLSLRRKTEKALIKVSKRLAKRTKDLEMRDQGLIQVCNLVSHPFDGV
jgi:hypothetical protein